MANNVVLMSLWQNDVDRKLGERAYHLLDKTSASPLRWLWIVGDSTDETERNLQLIVGQFPDKDITLLRHDTNVAGDEPRQRLLRGSLTASFGLEQVRKADAWWIIHESDLLSPVDLVDRFLATEKCPVAGWVTLQDFFYDTWAYRKDGVRFSNNAPYHACYKSDQLFEVDSAGSVIMLSAKDVRDGVRCDEFGLVEICEKLKALGRTIWVDPSIHIVQPMDLWVPRIGVDH